VVNVADSYKKELVQINEIIDKEMEKVKFDEIDMLHFTNTYIYGKSYGFCYKMPINSNAKDMLIHFQRFYQIVEKYMRMFKLSEVTLERVTYVEDEWIVMNIKVNELKLISNLRNFKMFFGFEMTKKEKESKIKILKLTL